MFHGSSAFSSAWKVTEFLRESRDHLQRMLLFCVDQEHTVRMRQAIITRMPTSRARITATSCTSPAGTPRGYLIDSESSYPVLITTSRLLSTDVDARTCRLIVLDRATGSMRIQADRRAGHAGARRR